MGFLDHLDELRTRLIRSCVAVAGGMLIALILTKLGEGFAFYLDVAFIGGLILAAPFV